jgi:hypothetical protein
VGIQVQHVSTESGRVSAEPVDSTEMEARYTANAVFYPALGSQQQMGNFS